MSQPFYQPARQNFSSSQSMQQPQGGFGGFGGGYQMPQQSFGGGFGGGYGSGFGFGGGFQPSFGGGFGGGYGSGFGGGFQPQQQFNPFQGGFGGFGGGYNPMFGGIGGLGFNPVMGQGFGMPMQGMRDPRVDMLGQQFGFASEEPMRAIHQLQSGLTPLQPQQQPQQNPFEEQQRQLRTQMEALPEYQAFQAAQNAYGAKQQELPEFIAAQNAQRALENSDALKSIQQKQQELQRMQARPMYGGLGSLGFNPMMGQQFSSDHMGDMMSRGGFEMSPEMRQRREQDMRNMERMAQQPELTFGTLGGTGEYDPKTGRRDLGTAGLAGGAPFTGPQRSAQDILSMAVGKTPQDMQYDLNKDGKITSADALAYQRQYGQQPAAPAPPQTTPRENDYVDSSGKLVSSQTGKRYRTASDMVKGDRIDAGETRTTSPLSSAMLSGLGNLGFNPMMGPQFGMPMQQLQAMLQGQQVQAPMEDWQQQQIRQFGRLSHNPYTGVQY